MFVLSIRFLILFLALSLFANPERMGQIRFKHFSMDEGLSQQSILCMLQDRKGYMWFGTQDGLNRFDGYEFKVFYYRIGETHGLADNFVWSMDEAADGRLFIGTANGLSIYDPSNNRFSQAYRHEDGKVNAIRALLIDHRGRVWLGTENGLFTFDEVSGFQKQALGTEDGLQIQVLLEDAEKRLWVGTRDGLYLLEKGRIELLKEATNHLANNNIWSIYQDSRGVVYVGTQNGLSIYDEAQQRFRSWRQPETTPYFQDLNQIYEIYGDKRGFLWLGTRGGLGIYDPLSDQVVNFRHDPLNPESLSYNRVWSILEDRFGTLWVGTTAGGLNLFDPAVAAFHQYKQVDDAELVSVYSMLADEEHLWVGTTGHGLERHGRDGVKRYEGEVFDELKDVWFLTKWREEQLLIGSSKGIYLLNKETEQLQHVVRSARIWGLWPSDDEHLWVSTRDGLRFLNGTFSNDKPEQLVGEPLLKDLVVRAMCLNEDGSVWAGTQRDGLVKFHPETPAIKKIYSLETSGLSHNHITYLFRSHKGTLWVGTKGGGLNQFVDEGRFEVYSTSNGLASDVIGAVVEDELGILWISTIKGISRLDPVTREIRNYLGQHGAFSKGYFVGSVAVDDYHNIYFGGREGYTVFHPRNIKVNLVKPEVVLTQFQTFNRKREKGSTIFDPNDSVTLDFSQNAFTVGFTALHYAAPQLHRYQYKLEGFDGEWTEVGVGQRVATYTNLPYGDYVFRVRAANHDNTWNMDGVSLGIKIDTPLWRTWWAYLIYELAFLGILLFLFVAHRQKLSMERAVVKRLKQVDELKDEFLANTSHELRTPLNGIIGLTESILAGVAEPVGGRTKEQLNMVVASGKRLAKLVDTILDFSKLKHHHLEVSLAPLNLYQLVDIVLNISTHLLGDKPVKLINDMDPTTPEVMGDEDRMSQILFNMVGNAIKFTEQGEIRVSTRVIGDRVKVSIRDTGIGISEDLQEVIFEPFKQADASMVRDYGGTGLGLAVSRKLVELHGGTLLVTSQPQQGATFSFDLAIASEASTQIYPAQVKEVLAVQEVVPNTSEDAFGEEENGNGRILIVDDEPVNRKVLRNYLHLFNYSVVEATDGMQALSLVDDGFDLVLLDIMMPRMSGYEVCRRIRETKNAQELPIILLTAKSRVVDVVEGFNYGANDYMTKPIDKDELGARIRTHMQLRTLTRELERLVEERTAELHGRYQELETLDQIVKTINREVNLSDVIQTLLEQGMTMFPRAETSVFLLLDPDSNCYRYIASVGYDTEQISKIQLSYEDIRQRYLFEDAHIEHGIYLISDFKKTSHGPIETYPEPASMIALDVQIEQRSAAILVLENMNDSDAFHVDDVARLQRFKEHAVSAVVRAKFLEDLVTSQRALVDAAHVSGMAEIATNMIHNAGNTLNSVQTSAQLIQDYLQKNMPYDLFEKIISAIEEDERGEVRAPEDRTRFSWALSQIIKGMKHRDAKLEAETSRLMDHLTMIRNVLKDQEALTSTRRVLSPLDLNKQIRETLQMESYLLKERNIQVVRHFAPLPVVSIEKQKLSRVLFYLIKNAHEAIGTDHGKITITTYAQGEQIMIEIADNGVGIEQGLLSQVFANGYTTKENVSGFGLHYCANAMKEMSGSIELFSEGEGKGTTVRLSFPINQNNDGDFEQPTFSQHG